MAEPSPVRGQGPILVVGLGNPGPNYAKNRHNVGFMASEILADRIGEKFKVHKKSGAEVVTGRLAGCSVVLAKPRVYMNESGRQVGPLARFFSVSPADIVVIHDELDIDFGRIRLKLGGGEGGHNGLRSVASALGTKDFQRVRSLRARELQCHRANRSAHHLPTGRRCDGVIDRPRTRTRPEHCARLGLAPNHDVYPDVRRL
jgi:PTH1 family peptidyl-tRNA hydrolase